MDLFEPLTDDEMLELEGFLDERAKLDTEGTMGLFHAIAVAPGMIAPSTWLEILFDEGAFEGREDVEEVVQRLMRFLNMVVGAVQAREPLTPPEDAIAECASFAKGFLAGVLADPQWADHEERFELCAWATLLMADPSINPGADVGLDEERAGPMRPRVRASMGGLILEAYDAFLPLRGAPRTPVRRGPQVGRNDPCPCGSGKKYKKCCAP